MIDIPARSAKLLNKAWKLGCSTTGTVRWVKLEGTIIDGRGDESNGWWA
jgi:hypothetical protein